MKWHQDIQFWPHSTFTPLTIGLYLNDVTDEMGPLGVVPLSSYNELSPLEDEHTGNWTGVLPGPVVKRLPLEEAVYLSGKKRNYRTYLGAGCSLYSTIWVWEQLNDGPTSMSLTQHILLIRHCWYAGSAGTITVHNARCVHGSRPNDSDVSRPLLLNTFTTASSRMLPFGTGVWSSAFYTRAHTHSSRQDVTFMCTSSTAYSHSIANHRLRFELFLPNDLGTNPLHENSVRGTPVIRGEPRPPKLDDRVRDGPWAPNFATGYTPPFFAPDEEGEGEKIEKKKGQVNTLDITKPRTL